MKSRLAAIFLGVRFTIETGPSTGPSKLQKPQVQRSYTQGSLAAFGLVIGPLSTYSSPGPVVPVTFSVQPTALDPIH